MIPGRIRMILSPTVDGDNSLFVPAIRLTPLFPQKNPIKAKYPEITDVGSSWTYPASRNRPITIRPRPRIAAPIPKDIVTVANIVSSSYPRD